MFKLIKKFPVENLIMFLFFCVSFVQFFSATYEFNTFGDRDLIRSLEFWENFQIYGAEINQQGGKRVNGGFLYFFLNPFIYITNGNIDYIFTLIKFINLLSLILLFNFLKQKISYLFSAISLLAITTSIYQSNFLNIFWNPTIGFGFVNLSYLFLFKFYFKPKTKYLYIGSIINLLAVQLHFSFIIIYIFFLLTMLMKKIKIIHFLNILIILPAISYTPNLIYNFTEIFNSIDDPLKIYNLGQYEKGLNIKQDLIVWLRMIYYDLEFIQSSKNIKFYLPLGLFFLLIFSFYFLLKKPNYFLKNKVIKHFFKFNLILSGIGLIIISLGNSYIDGEIVLGGRLNRYFNFLVPLMASLTSISILIIIYSTKYKNFILIFICFFFSIKSLNYLTNEYKNVKLLRSQTPFEIEAFQYLNKNKNYSLEKIRNNTVLTFLNNNDQLHHLEEKSFDFYFKFKNVSFKRDNDYCLLIIYKNFYNYNPIKINIKNFTIKPNKLLYDQAKFEYLGESKNFYYFNYNFINNFSCQSNLLNDYILLDNEKLLLEKLQKKSNFSYKEKQSINDINYYYHFSKKKLSFKFSVELSKINNENYEVNLVSKDLRNSKTALNGIYSEKHASGAQIIFKNKSTLKTKEKLFSNSIIGRKHNVTPKKVNIELSPGNYEVYLKLDYFFDTTNKIKYDNIIILLDTKLKI